MSNRRAMARVLCLLGLSLLVPPPMQAHQPSDSYLSLRWRGDALEGRWDIALKDLELAIGLDADQDGDITWGELRSRHDAMTAYALSRLVVSQDGAACRTHPGEPLVVHHSDGAYSVLPFEVRCPRAGGHGIALEYRLLFDLDPSHRGLLRFENRGDVETAVLSPDSLRVDLQGGRSATGQLAEYWREGVFHIWQGFDHLLFLLTLLLPSVLRRETGRWLPVESFGGATRRVAVIVTAFTIAHSITLSLAVLEWVSLPSRWVEATIAMTVVLVAANNLRPFLRGRLWFVTFCLGLIHGFGFATVLTDLRLPGRSLALALAGFNLGVETGQLVVVAALLPIVFVIRSTVLYRRLVLVAGSALAGCVGLLWFLERALDLHFR